MAEGEKRRSPRMCGRYRGYVGDYCCVPGCNNSRGKCSRENRTVSFYKLPTESRRRRLWLDRIRRDVVNEDGKIIPFQPKSHTRICSDHFFEGCKSDDPDSQSYIPSIFARRSTQKRTTQTSEQAGFNTPVQQSTRKRKILLDSVGRPKVPKRLDYLQSKSKKAVWETTDHDYVKTKLDSTMPSQEQTSTAELNELKQENENLKSKMLRLSNIKENDEKFQFYTNLPNYQVFKALVTYLQTRKDSGGVSYWRGKDTNLDSTKTKKGRERKFTFEEEVFIVLVKLKTGNFNEDLALTFDTSPAHISKIFSTIINFMCNELKLMFEMQSNESEKAKCFEPFENLKVVIDCTELMVQRSSNLDARKKTFSNYKHNDTVKFLVGLSPCLSVNYVSQAWGGRASDKHITMESEGLMNGLQAGETVMADRGFNVSNDLKKKGVKLLIPEFKGRDRPQMTAREARRSEYISKARIHVERVIQRIKTFYLLERVIRLNMQDLVEQIFTTCAYLTNFQLPIIRK